MSTPLHVAYLADHERLIPTLAYWHYSEWSHLRPGETLETRTARLRSCCRHQEIPTVLVALRDGVLLGSAILVAHDMETRIQWTPWLGGVFVVPERRREGIGAALVSHAVEAEAAYRYQCVDPGYRLVAADLERKLEEAKPEVRRVERLVAVKKEEPPILDDDAFEELCELCGDFMALWNAETTTNHDRKEITRTMVKEVVVEEKGPAVVRIRIVWQDGEPDRLARGRRSLPNWRRRAWSPRRSPLA